MALSQEALHRLSKVIPLARLSVSCGLSTRSRPVVEEKDLIDLFGELALAELKIERVQKLCDTWIQGDGNYHDLQQLMDCGESLGEILALTIEDITDPRES